MEFPTGAGATGGPISPDAWKRAVYRSAPRNFYVELLSPEKQGGSHSYGLRVCPIKGDDVSIASRSTSSGGSANSLIEYDIWRKWEDCLWFQETLEVEYSRMAREKRNRLAAGKGVKKNGVYIHSDQAASFESLPPGPDPHSVARDIHDVVPKLTKKGTLFRASQATIDQRFAEFQAMIDALFRDDVPMLIKELRATRTFTDFFGFWRRDHDLAKKTQKEVTTPVKPRSSVSSSLFSAYFSASTPALSELSVPPSSVSKQPVQRQLPRRASAHSDSSSSSSSIGPSRTSKSLNYGQSTDNMRPMRLRAGSSRGSPTSPSLPSTPVIASRQLPAAARQPDIVSQESPLRFGHNPDVLGNERPTSMLESLPEDREFSSPAPAVGMEDGKRRLRRRAGSTASEANRGARIYVTPPHSPSGMSEYSELPPEPTTPSPSRYPRYSWQTTHSSASGAAAYFDELSADYSLPSPHPEYGHRPRASMCSMASVMTDSSVDAVIPRYPGHASANRSAMNGRHRPRPMSFPEDEEGWADHEPWVAHDEHEPEEDLLDAYFYDSIRPLSPTPSSLSRAQTPIASELSPYIAPSPEQQYSQARNIALAYSARRSSLAASVSSGSTNSSHDGMSIYIKAMHEDNIIKLRIPRHLSFEILRQKIYEKFVQTERSPISESFAIALLVPPPTDRSGGARPRAGSLSSLGHADSKKSVLHFVASQEEWDHAIAFYGSNVLLRIIGSRE
ncbi:hypothetical protein HYDPIDRAFT_29982 [Hydnomerulius pinastri MD-312]|uniref:PX domain-containing protein n=1 Tax=Hydnomerulius pinastri MD-312 TaxID=994086 RepID=A0A0C9WDX2_9AGAM|nr:hypothetical protein HYDPIDRAFT_29982 [Hydnomerulius pinastri MD-312]